VSVFPRFAPRLQEAIVARLGWSSLRPVQDAAGAALLDGDNAVVLAPTAGGKTEAAMFPVLSAMVSDPPLGVGALYIAPIKALLNNQADRLGNYTEMVGLRRFVWHGDTPSSERKRFLKEPAELLMTTPESLEVMLISKSVDGAVLFADVRVVIIDEIHAVAGTDRGAHLMSVLERIARLSRHDLQRVGLSATVGNPAAILTWLQGTSKRASRIVDPPKVPGRRQLLVLHRPEMAQLALDAARIARGGKSLLFCQSRAVTETVSEQMRRAGTAVFVHHSAVSREERALAEDRFAHGTDACIVCTSTLELGIDVGDLDRVLQAEAPDTVSSFLQRMGRTGRRAGMAANTTFLCETEQAVLQAIALIELARAGWVENVDVQDRCWPVFIHQILAMSLASDGVPIEAAWAHLSRVPDFSGITRGEYNRLIAWMFADGGLINVGGSIVLGPKAEKRFGRRNFMELYAVFSSPQTYTVQTMAGQPLGTLSQGFVDRLVEGVSSFLLAGRAWLTVQLRHGERIVKVEAGPQGRQPSWGGFLPQFLGFEVCQKILGVLRGVEIHSYLHPDAAAVLARRREAFDGILSDRGGIEIVDGEVRWWTFAGGRINATLRYALEAVGGDWKVIPDNFLIKVRGEHLDRATFDDAVARIRELEFWEDEKLWAEVAANLPNYRLSKFQPLMPPWVEREVVASYLLDVAGAWRWLTGSEPGLARVPRAVTAARQEDVHAPSAALPEVPAPTMTPTLPVRWVADAKGLAAACDALATARSLGLDVETTLHSRALCLVQVASTEAVYLFDALAIEDLSPLGAIFADPTIEKIIHNAAFERSVLSRYGIALENVLDTLAQSRALRGKVEGGHSLRAVCARELGVELDKGEQTSDWTRRPLTARQVAYAALDAEILLRVRAALG
jgi:ATP-dependent Lhr-like helicase